MTAALHREYVGTVKEWLPWGILVCVDGEAEILVDRTKVGDAIPEPGAAVIVVVLDDSRIPMRGSLLIVDREIARRLRVARPER